MQTDKIMQFSINNCNGCDDIKDKTNGRKWIFIYIKEDMAYGNECKWKHTTGWSSKRLVSEYEG